VDAERENKLFLSALWAFLISALVFFFIYISAGRIKLPPSVWFAFLLIDAGFIVFLFVPLPGRQKVGGRKRPRRKEWYPRDLGEIVERRDDESSDGPGMLRPGRAVGIVPLLPLLILLFVIILAAPFGSGEEAWIDRETERLTSIYGEASGTFAGLEHLLGEVGAEAAGLLARWDVSTAVDLERIDMIHAIDSLAVAAAAGIEPVEELGIQVFTPGGHRLAWGGRPRYDGRVDMREDGTKIFIARARLFTVLVRDMPLESGGRVVIDLPLEVNYRISNRFLRSTSLGEIISRRHGVEVEYSYWMGRRSGSAGEDGESDGQDAPEASRTADGAVRTRGLLRSSDGIPLARLTIGGETYAAAAAGGSRRRATWAGFVLTLLVIVIARWIYNGWGKRMHGRESRLRCLLRRIVLLIFFLGVIRYLLLRLEMPGEIFGVDLFDSALFADDAPGGLMRTAGDYLISSAFMLTFVFGLVKSFRTYYGGILEKRISRGNPFGPVRMMARSALLAGILSAVVAGATLIVSRTVLNSNPRLIGLDAELFSIPALTLHTALLFSVAAIFIAAIFLFRLLLSWGGGPKGEAAVSVAASLFAVYFLLHPHWSGLVAAAALIFLASRIFPMLRKEEILSVVFTSFFLVLICSVVIFGIASRGYDEIRRTRVEELAGDINDPGENMFELALQFGMEEIAADRSLVSKIMSRTQSAAFEIWAESDLSGLGKPCVFDVFDATGTKFSSFSIGIPFEIAGVFDDAGDDAIGPGVVGMVRDSDFGKVFYFVGVTPVSHPSGRLAGRVEVKWPYHYENPAMLTSAGPAAPEILRNVERGSVTPRIDEPEKLLVARVEGGFVAESSDPSLRTGTPLHSEPEEWFVHDTGDRKYHCVYFPGEGDLQYVVGYLSPGFNGSVLMWATVISVDIIVTIVSLALLLLVRKLPVFGSVTPAVSLRGGLGFRRKLLLSFAVVSMIPVLLMGVFSSRYIQYRNRVVGESEAYEAASSAGALLRHGVRAEAEAFGHSRYLGEMLESGEAAAGIDAPDYEDALFTLIDAEGRVILDDSRFPVDSLRISVIRDEAPSARVTITWGRPGLYAGTVIPISLPERPGGFLYYRRKLDDEFISRTSAVLGRNLNIYYRGKLSASSERELFVGGFLGTLLAPRTYADVALGGSKAVVTSESLGDYSYQVSSIAIPPLARGESAVLSVPHLYRTAIVQAEVMRTSAVLLGLLVLILCVAVILGVFLAGKIFNPIAELRVGTKRVIRGDLEFRLESGATDEIGELVDSFNTMTGALAVARRDLLERQRYFAAVLDNIATGVISAESGGRIVTLNPAGERILGMSKEELIGTEAAAAGGPHLKVFFDLFALETGNTIEGEISLEQDGERRTLKTVVAGLSEGGERLGTVIVFDDLTELIRTKKLAAWIEMARQIAHEVKNPLTPIKLSAQLMKRAYDAGSDEFDEIFSSGIDTVMQQTEILRQISSEFSSFGRSVDLKRENIEIEEFITGIIAGYSGVEDVTIGYEGGGGAVLADSGALRKIIVNLIENALEAIQGGGEIAVEHEVSGGTARISVTDTGTGLSGEAEEKLFEPYFSTKTNGTGLGLAICQNLAREMDGEILLRNREDARGVKAVVILSAVKEDEG
jgi:PAS domain S-box-containing protein